MAESNGAVDVCFDVNINIEIEDVEHEEQDLSRPKVVEKYHGENNNFLYRPGI